MKTPINISVIVTNENITIYFDKKALVVNKTKNPATFEKVLEKITKNDLEWVVDNIGDIAKQIEAKTDNVLSVNDQNNIVIKGTNIPAPPLIVKKLMELEEAKTPIEPLLRFWRKLSLNPSENSRNDLFDFMTRNNINITTEGDIVLEKGVNIKKGSYPGHLIDCHTGNIDNSVGTVVSIPREKVNADNSKTCSFGLHAGAPDYVRNYWNSDIIVEVIVDPRNVVAVPKDYNATKMRVCEYRVVGYADSKTRGNKHVVKLSDFITVPTPEQAKKMGDKVKKIPKKAFVKTKEDLYNLKNLTSKQIVDLVFKETGESITISLKSKASIIKRAEKALGVNQLKS